MIELSRHIEVLLLKHDCVIVPQLGGFVTQYVSARCEKNESLMLPPHRTIGFNSEMTLNDGLLVQSYMQAYDASYPETLRIVDDAVSRLKNQLRTEGSFEFHGIGVLRLNLDGTYHFTPHESGILSPELYGLSSLPLRPLKASRETLVAETDSAEESQQKPQHYTLSLNRELCNYVAAAVVAVVFYFLWTTPVGSIETSAESGNMAAAVAFAKPAEKAVEKTVAPPKAEPVKQDTIAAAAPVSEQKADSVVAPKAEQSKPEVAASEQPKAEAEMPVGGYTIVLSSAISLDNAAELVEKLGAQGVKAMVYRKNGGMVRVISGQWAEEAAAYAALNSQRTTNADFQDAWVMELK